VIRRLKIAYRVSGVIGVYRYISACLHVGMAHLLGRWAGWHDRMAVLLVEDVVDHLDDG